MSTEIELSPRQAAAIGLALAYWGRMYRSGEISKERIDAMGGTTNAEKMLKVMDDMKIQMAVIVVGGVPTDKLPELLEKIKGRHEREAS